jgi:hypothetical protein
MATKKAREEAVPLERANFKLLLLTNPNYFGNLEQSTFKPSISKPMIGNDTYEAVTCVGLNPSLDLLEAVVEIKQPNGYSGGICSNGSIEYVRFYAEYTAGNWTDLGYAQVRVFDAPGPHPICYHVKLQIEPPREYCRRASTVRIRAILGWETLPPPNTPEYNPPWGNRLDVHVQPQPFTRRPFKDLFEIDLAQVAVLEKISDFIDPATQFATPIKKLSLVEKHQLYEKTDVPLHRYADDEIQKFSTASALPIASTPFAALKLSPKAITNFLDQIKVIPQSNTTYEELACTGFRPEDDSVTAVVTIKRPNGYSGSLCQQGSDEYVAFWFKPQGAGSFTYLGTAAVRVHDLATVPRGGVQYAVVLPVDTTTWQRLCTDGAAIGTLRAVLRWNAPPSTTDPDAIPYWGDREECNIQLKPGDPATATLPALLDISNIPADAASINPLTGLTIGSDSPFGGTVAIRGRISGFTPRQYMIEVRPEGALTWTPLSNTITLRITQYSIATGNIVDCDPATPLIVNTVCTRTISPVTDAQGTWYDYLNADSGGVRTQLMDHTLGYWNTNINNEGRWEIRLTFRDAGAPMPIPYRPSIKIRIDNTAPRVDAWFNDTPNCGRYTKGEDEVVSGGWSVNDRGSNPMVADPTLPEYQHFSSLEAVLLPFAGTISFVPTPPVYPSLPTTGGSGTWSLPTGELQPCGYVIRFIARDRTIYGGVSGGGIFQTTSLSAEDQLGFCLDPAGPK